MLGFCTWPKKGASGPTARTSSWGVACDYLGEAASIGLKRAEALRVAEEQLDKLARLLPNAIDAGIGVSEIARVADVSRPTLYELRARYSDNWRYVLLGVLQATLVGGSSSDIAELIGRSLAEVDALLTS